MTDQNSRGMLYMPLPTEEDGGFRKPVPTLTGVRDDPTPTTTDAPTAETSHSSRPTSTPTSWNAADD